MIGDVVIVARLWINWLLITYHSYSITKKYKKYYLVIEKD
ncbi:hypothetical protein FDUTEX481_03950 [Tolypothrix sp. PCC 7601]|nr:hypothetical protein FDUTEX481_03950 [Tolypothrix sp. PCC 7601]